MADRRIGNPSMGRRGCSKMESGTCIVCSAPCSSCLHRNAGTGSKSDESSDENSHGVVASQYSVNEDDLLHSSGVNAFGSSHNTASEASNLVNSNHDPSSENAESKEIIRSSDISDVPNLGGSSKISMMMDSCDVLPKEVKSQPSHSLLFDHQARNNPGQGKVKEKSGADKKNVLFENSTHSDESAMAEKPRENNLLNRVDEPNPSAMSESESADSEMLELDVKVCDICGDAGREDLLAICSRCSDGAEHTYCMRVMLRKVPEGDWLCEECKFAEEAQTQKLEAKGKSEAEVNLNTQSSSKRHIDKLEAAPDAKRQAVEAPTGSLKRPVLPNLPALSQETSFKGLENTTRKLAHQSSFNSHSSDGTESTRSTDSKLRSPEGSFFKSNSFNFSSSRPKKRAADDVMLPRQITGRENASLDVKEGVCRNVGRSMSTRCIDVGSSSCNASKVKSSKQLKDPNAEANPSASTVDQIISRGNLSSSYANSARNFKGLQSVGKQGSLTKQARYLSRNLLEDKVTSVGDTSTNEKCRSSEQISNEAKRKDELANVDGLSRSSEFREVGEKSKEAVGNRQRSDLLSGSKGLPSQKGQNAEPTEMSCASGSNLSTTRNIRENINNGNRLRAAVDAALRKKPSFGKNRESEHSDLSSVSTNVDCSFDKAIQNLPSKVPVVRDWRVGLQGHPSLQTDKQTIPVNGKQFTLAGDAMVGFQSVEPEVHLPSVKPVMRDLPEVASSVLSTTSAIPENEYIWQGDMEVHKSRNLSLMHCGMQAYLSTLASPKVVEVANQFPVKVTLNEVTRLSTWPAQFQDRGATEDHVALFFFAKDIESYEKSYKPLVDNMIQKDLALKGNFEGVELLIFASNQLPQNCQRWNMLFFLWGVFRGKKEKCSNSLKNKPLPASNVLPNLGKAVSTREGFCQENISKRESSIDCASSKMQLCTKEENGREDEACGAIDKENGFSISYGDNGAVEETEEGEIDASPHLRHEKISGPRTVNSSDMIQKVDSDDLNRQGLFEGAENKKLNISTGVETECSISRRDTSASRKSGAGPCEEEEENITKKKPDATERIVFPLDLNDGKEDDDDEMVDSNPRPPLGNDNNNNERRSLGMVPNLELALGEEKTIWTNTKTTGVVLPFMAGTSCSIEEDRSSSSQKLQDQMVKQEDDAASLSLSLSLSSMEKEQQQKQQQNQRSVSELEHKKQNVNTPIFLFRDFPDK